jgi:Xaa-Pro aminopeptidase
LPIQAAEHIPVSDDFAAQLSQITAGPDARRAAGFLALYLRKIPEEVAAIRLANRVANMGLRVFAENLKPDVTEAEAAAEVESAIYRQIGNDGIFHSRRPDVSAGDIEAMARNKIAAAQPSDSFPHLSDHHVGFRYRDPGFPIAPGISAQLEPGMVITIEPGVYSTELGSRARIEDNVLVTKSGHEVLSMPEGVGEP